MATKIIYVVSNLNHNGTQFAKGSFCEGDTDEFGTLFNDGVLEVVKGAKTIEQAQKIKADQASSEAEATVAAVEPENTWGPKKDPIPEDEAKPVTTDEQVKTTTDQKVENVDTKPEEIKAPIVGTGDVAPKDEAKDL